MTVRPLHRWKSFWLGVLVLGFLGWAWVRSRSWLDGFLWVSGSNLMTGGQHAGAVSWAWDSSRLPFLDPLFEWRHEPVSSVGEPLIPRALVWETYPGQAQLTVAHWFLMLVFLMSWAGFLAWRWRRVRATGQVDSMPV